MPLPKTYDALLQMPAERWMVERLDEIAGDDRSRASVARELIREALAARDARRAQFGDRDAGVRALGYEPQAHKIVVVEGEHDDGKIASALLRAGVVYTIVDESGVRLAGPPAGDQG